LKCINNQERRQSPEGRKDQQNGVRIGAWNVRTLLQAGKLENLKTEMVRNKLDIIGLSEIRWEGSGELASDEMTLFYSGDVKGMNGVGFIVNRKIRSRVQRVIYEGDRIIAIRLGMKPKDVLIIQVYMPTSQRSDEEIEEIYERIERIMDEEGKDCCKILTGDWNAVVGEGRVEQVVGGYGLGERNERGERLIEFCKERKLLITNTWFRTIKGGYALGSLLEILQGTR